MKSKLLRVSHRDVYVDWTSWNDSDQVQLSGEPKHDGGVGIKKMSVKEVLV